MCSKKGSHHRLCLSTGKKKKEDDREGAILSMNKKAFSVSPVLQGLQGLLMRPEEPKGLQEELV